MRRLSDDEWMNKHFGISCHAGDVAEAVLELFESVTVETFPARVADLPEARQFVLRTASEVQR